MKEKKGNLNVSGCIPQQLEFVKRKAAEAGIAKAAYIKILINKAMEENENSAHSFHTGDQQ